MLTAVCQDPDVTFGPSRSWHGVAPIVWEQLRIYLAQSMPRCKFFLLFLCCCLLKFTRPPGLTFWSSLRSAAWPPDSSIPFVVTKKGSFFAYCTLYTARIYSWPTKSIIILLHVKCQALWLQRRNLFHHKWLLGNALEIPYAIFQWLLSQQI